MAVHHHELQQHLAGHHLKIIKSISNFNICHGFIVNQLSSINNKASEHVNICIKSYWEKTFQ